MFKLYLNGQPAIVSKGSSIKLTRCNPCYEEKGDFTLSVELPLAGVPQNRTILGTPDRQEASRTHLVGLALSFSLLTDSLTLDGTATVQKVTESSASLQLKSSVPLTDTASLDGAERYIDELDLGRAWSSVYQELYGDYCRRKGITPEAEQSHRWTLACILSSPAWEQLLHGTSEQTDCVCFPVWSTADGAWANKHDYLCFGELQYDSSTYRHAGQCYIPWGYGSVQNTAIPQPGGGRPEEWAPYIVSDETEDGHILDRLLSPQPYLCALTEKILAALGYELAPADNALRQSPWMSRIFLASARRTLRIARCLPHWTVAQFFKHLRETLNLIFIVQGTSVSVISRRLYYNDQAALVPLRSTADPHVTDISADKASQDTSSGNIGYDFSDVVPPILNIGEDAYESLSLKYQHRPPETEDLRQVGEDDKQGSRLLYICYDDKRERYGIFRTAQGDYTFVRVDHMGPVLRDADTKTDLRLKMVPAMMTEKEPCLRRYMNFLRLLEGDTPHNEGFAPQAAYPAATLPDPQRAAEGGQLGSFYPPTLITADTRIPENRVASLQAWIQSGAAVSEVENEKQDLMELALNYGDTHQRSYLPVYLAGQTFSGLSTRTATIPHPAAIPYLINRLLDGSGTQGETYPHVKTVDRPHYDFALNGDTNIRREIDGGGWQVDTRCVFQVEYLDDYTDPMLPVLIRGRKYVCQKLEVTIDESGLQPLKRGYFLEVSG